MGCQPWHSALGSRFPGLAFLTTTVGRGLCSSPRRWAAQAGTPSFGALLSFLKTQPHRCFSLGKRTERPRSWGSRAGSASKPARSTPKPRRFWHALFSLPWGPIHELVFCRLSYCGWPPIRPKFCRGDASDYGTYVAFPCAAQKAAGASRGGWWMAREGAGGPSGERDRGSARRESSDAKSVLIMAIQDRSKTAFLIWHRKHATR